MEIYYSIIFFIFGTIFGSFYNVVGSRLPLGKSILYPPSHCNECNHKLSIFELIPVLSFIFLRGRCKNCKQKFSWFYPLSELISGLLFMGCYLRFSFSIDLIISLIFISMLIVIIISDYQTFIIPDEVLITSIILLIVPLFIKGGIKGFGISLLNGIIAFSIMFLLKKIGDFIFKKESMGGGDIKLMFIFGFVLGWPQAILSIFIASFIGLPISLITLSKNKSHEIPFGPFLAISSMIILFSGIDFNSIINLLVK